MGLKDQFNAKKANFRRLIAKIGHYSHILAFIIHLLSIFIEYVEEFLEFKKLDFRGLKGQFDVKMANLGD